MNDFLIVMALKEEGGIYFENNHIPILYTGLGKVNAAYQLTKYLQSHRPKGIINFGTAGSSSFVKGSLVEVTQCIQRDMDVTPLGFKKGETPFDQLGGDLNLESKFHNLPKGICGTGDSFEMNHATDRYNLVDMEVYALAKICALENIPFSSVKFISDGADDQAHNDWNESIKSAPRHFWDFFKSTSFLNRV